MTRRLTVNAVPEHPEWHYGLTIAHGDGIISLTLYGPKGKQLEIDHLDTAVWSKHAEADRLITEHERQEDSKSTGHDYLENGEHDSAECRKCAGDNSTDGAS